MNCSAKVVGHKSLLRTAEFPYHITARTNNREGFPTDMGFVWKFFCKNLEYVSYEYGANIHSFVLMPNHIHLLVSTPLKNIDEIMNYVLRETSKRINYKSDRINHIFGSRYRWSSIQSVLYYSTAYKYVYQNPLRANLIVGCENYPYSSLQFKLGLQSTAFPICLPSKGMQGMIEETPGDQLKWLNCLAQTDEKYSVMKGLRKKIFKPTYATSKSVLKRY